MVEGKGIEPLTHACKAHVFPLAPTPQIHGDQGGNRTPTNGFGDHRTAIILPGQIYTLLPMCVLKHSKLLRLPVRKECFNTLGFFYVQEHKPSPRPPVYFLECLWDRVSVCTKMKNPRVFSSGVLGRYTNIV